MVEGSRVSVSLWKTGLDDAMFAADVILDCADRVHDPTRPDTASA